MPLQEQEPQCCGSAGQVIWATNAVTQIELCTQLRELKVRVKTCACSACQSTHRCTGLISPNKEMPFFIGASHRNCAFFFFFPLQRWHFNRNGMGVNLSNHSCPDTMKFISTFSLIWIEEGMGVGSL